MYSKINWQADTLLTPARFRHMETQYDEVLAYWVTNSFRIATSAEFRPEILSSAPAHASARNYLNSTDTHIHVSDGSAWINLSEYGETV